MPDSTFDAAKHVDHMAAVLGLAIDPAYMTASSPTWPAPRRLRGS